jgi:hypothetical protein
VLCYNTLIERLCELTVVPIAKVRLSHLFFFFFFFFADDSLLFSATPKAPHLTTQRVLAIDRIIGFCRLPM